MHGRKERLNIRSIVLVLYKTYLPRTVENVKRIIKKSPSLYSIMFQTRLISFIGVAYAYN